MEPEREERLNRYLRTVKELKTENEGLVGTKDIYKFLKEQEKLFDTPQKVSNELNNEIKKVFPKPTYASTIDRLSGLQDFGSEIFDNRFLIDRNFYLGAFDLENYIFSSKEGIQQAVQFYLPFFMQANLEGICDNVDIGSIVNSVLERDYNAIKERIPAERREEFDEFYREIVKSIIDFDWQDELSREARSGKETDIARMNFEEMFDPVFLTARVMADRTDNRIEYRRRVLGHVLSRWTNEIIDKSWEGFIHIYNRRIRNARRNLENFRQFKEGVEVSDSRVVELYKEHLEICSMRGEEPKSVDEQIQTQQKHLETFVFIRRLLGQEKNWVEKVLRAN